MYTKNFNTNKTKNYNINDNKDCNNYDSRNNCNIDIIIIISLTTSVVTGDKNSSLISCTNPDANRVAPYP